MTGPQIKLEKDLQRSHYGQKIKSHGSNCSCDQCRKKPAEKVAEEARQVEMVTGEEVAEQKELENGEKVVVVVEMSKEEKIRNLIPFKE